MDKEEPEKKNKINEDINKVEDENDNKNIINIKNDEDENKNMINTKNDEDEENEDEKEEEEKDEDKKDEDEDKIANDNKSQNKKNKIKTKAKQKNGEYKNIHTESCKNIINNISLKEKDDKDADNNSNNSNLDLEIAQIDDERDREDGFNSGNNLINLSNLFRDYINRFDENKIFRKTKRNRSIYKVKRNFKSNIIINENENDIKEENDSINLYNIIKDRLTEVKQDTLYYLDEAKRVLESKYNYFIKKINELLFEKEEQISKLLGVNNKNDNFINYANNHLFKKIDDVLEIHENIFSALEDHFNLLYSFLEQASLVQQKKPIEYFINNFSSDILNCWFLNKIDFNQINLTNIISNKELSDLCAGYLSKTNKNVYPYLSIQKDEEGNLPLEIEILYKNVNQLNKIKVIGLNKDDVNKILKENKTKNKNSILNKKYIDGNISSAKKLKNLSIINCNLITDNLPKITFPALKKFRLKRSFITFGYLFKSILGETNSLIQIFIEDIKMTDNSLRIFFDYLSSKKSIFETLKNLSFKGNKLTKINFLDFNIEIGQLKNLQYLNFAKNNLYEFAPYNFKVVPELKVVDLTDNNISNSLLFETIRAYKQSKFIVLLSNNIFIHNNSKNNFNYIKYITDKLTSFEHKIKKISFSLLFNRDNLEYLTKLKISPAVKITICKLNLSFCGLNDENLWKFFRNNFGLLNLEELNLSNNFFTDNLFNLCSGLHGDILLEQLYMIDLSGNNIECRNIKDLMALDTFVDNHIELRRIKLQQNNFIYGVKKLLNSKDNKEQVINIIQSLNDKNIKIVLENELNDYVNISKILGNLFLFKDKTY